MENKKIPFKMFLPGIAWFFIVDALTLMPASDVPEVGWMDNIPNFDKLVHAALFGGLTLLFSFPFFKAKFSFRKKIHYFTKIAISSSIWGLAVEFIQKFFIPSRDFDLLDWAADSIGALIAFGLCMQILKYIQSIDISKKSAASKDITS